MKHKHHVHLLRKLKQKGWSETELAHAQSVFTKSESQKSEAHRFLDRWLLWAVFAVIVAGNIIAMLAFMPLLPVFTHSSLYTMFFLLGICFGFLYQVLLQDIQHQFSGHHHLFVLILIPYLAIVGGVLILTYAQRGFAEYFVVSSQPWLMGLSYAFGFLLPYIFTLLAHHHSVTRE